MGVDVESVEGAEATGDGIAFARGSGGGSVCSVAEPEGEGQAETRCTDTMRCPRRDRESSEALCGEGARPEREVSASEASPDVEQFRRSSSGRARRKSARRRRNARNRGASQHRQSQAKLCGAETGGCSERATRRSELLSGAAQTLCASMRGLRVQKSRAYSSRERQGRPDNRQLLAGVLAEQTLLGVRCATCRRQRHQDKPQQRNGRPSCARGLTTKSAGHELEGCPCKSTRSIRSQSYHKFYYFFYFAQ